MLPGMGGMNPAKMKAMMKQLGINQEEIDAERVVIHKTGGGQITIDQPSVQKITMQGQTSFQISGEIHEGTAEPTISDEDISLVAEKTGASADDARTALEETGGDIAEAIVKLSG